MLLIFTVIFFVSIIFAHTRSHHKLNL